MYDHYRVTSQNWKAKMFFKNKKKRGKKKKKTTVEPIKLECDRELK